MSSVDKLITNLQAKGYETSVVDTGVLALKKIKELVPKGASVMNGSSVTLEQIGFVEYLKSGEHRWNNLHAAIVAEKDPSKQELLRKQALLSDYYLGSVHALAETGEFVVASNTGSQLPHIVFSSTNLIFVVGQQKIVPDLTAALKRLEEYVIPLENQHMLDKYKVGTTLNKLVIFKGESPYTKRKIHFILVKETLGF
jgi:L-lactate utilization protein LutC